MFVLVSLLVLSSCEDVETHDQTIQAVVGDRLFTTDQVTAALNGDGSLTIKGMSGDESLKINLFSARAGDFQLGSESRNSATFTNYNEVEYSTNPDGRGIVNISKIDELSKTLSGTFNFSASNGRDTLYVSRGILYNVSYGGQAIPDPTNDGIFKAKIDGNSFVAQLIMAKRNGDILAINGSNVEKGIGLYLPHDVTPGTYDVSDEFSDYSAVYQDFNNHEETIEGEINVIAHDMNAKTIKGTFWFTNNSHQITDGEFNVEYQIFN